MAGKECVKRLQKEIRMLSKEPPPQIVARPSSSDILDWHYVLEGSKGTPFEGGYYYGKLKFPSDYPYKPPSISMVTPNGRFATEKNICLSMSNFHPESWNPMWSVSSILTGLLSFMMDDQQTTGSIRTSDDDKRKLAKNSLAYNCQSKACFNFRKLFPEYVEMYNQQLNSVQPPRQQNMQQDNQNPSVVEQVAQQNIEVKRGVTNAAHKRQRKQLPFWLVLFLISIFGALMSLPLMQL